MGGAKKKSPAQQEKSQQDESTKKTGSKKGKKGEKSEGGSGKAEITVTLTEEQASKALKNAKVMTVQELSRQTGVKVSAANQYLLQALQKGTVKRVGGFSGHHIYQPVSE